jgi:CRISPR/Cas system CMR subunit Cmr4 (Cas7 group RAMP superfamily)
MENRRKPSDADDVAGLLVLLDALRLVAPAELQDRFTALIREALLTLRALIDWYLERLDEAPTERKIEDIPID